MKYKIEKKIIIFCLVSMFLLLNCTSFLAVGQKANTTKQNIRTADDLPDLAIKVVITTNTELYKVNSIIYNIGTVPVPKGAYFNWEIHVPGEINNSITVELGDPLEPGMSILGIPNEFAPIYLKRDSGREVTVIVDTLNQIKESNKQNNFDTEIFPCVRSHYSFSLLFSLLNKFPIFQRILEI